MSSSRFKVGHLRRYYVADIARITGEGNAKADVQRTRRQLERLDEKFGGVLERDGRRFFTTPARLLNADPEFARSLMAAHDDE